MSSSINVAKSASIATSLAQKLKIKNIFMFGAPGVGKGTYGGLLARDLNLKKISTGDEIRKILKKDNLSGEMIKIKNQVERGEFISDKMALDLVYDACKDLSKTEEEMVSQATVNSIENNTSQTNFYNGVMLDGIPRTKEQIRMLAELIDLSQSYVINCTLREDILIEKLLGRRVCSDCGEGYNVCEIDKDNYFMEPLLPKKNICNCDKCGGKQISRADDKVDIIRKRLDVYHNMTEPILGSFCELNLKRIDFEAFKGVADYPKLYNLVRNNFSSFSA